MSNNDFMSYAEKMISLENAAIGHDSIGYQDDDFNIDSLRHNHEYAECQYEIIKKQIIDFEKTLDDTKEVAIRLASFNRSMMMLVREIGYANPSLIIFHGIVEEQPARLIQHISQLNFLLTAAPRVSASQPRRPIGFLSSIDI